MSDCEEEIDIKALNLAMGVIKRYWGTPKAAVPLGLMVSGANNSKVWKIG